MAEYRHLVRIANTDLDGSKKILFALRKIKGVDIMVANAICHQAAIDKTTQTGSISEQQANKISEIIEKITQQGFPEWLLNRRKEPETGENMHLSGPNLKFTQENDIKLLKKIKSYKGLRHQWRLPVRGQRTKSNFRRNKGKSSLGVKKKINK